MGREILRRFKISQSFHFFEMTFLIFSCSLSKTIALTFFLLQIAIYSQTDWARWEKANIYYEDPSGYHVREYDLSINSPSDIILKPLVNGYWFFISDVDGANCPFSPSCSTFFLQAAEETNPAQALLMFFDRFTRDTNFANRHEHYPRVKDGRFYDPVSDYMLDDEKIKYISPDTYINK